jgi:hypothetical protein
MTTPQSAIDNWGKTPLDKIQFRRSGDWTMVYLNGFLVQAGDHYHADEWLQARAGVEVVDDEAGLCIPDGHNAIRSLAEVEEAEARQAARAKEADALRQEAHRLMERADTLEGKA